MLPGDSETPPADETKFYDVHAKQVEFVRVALDGIPPYRNEHRKHKIDAIKLAMRRGTPLPPIYLRPGQTFIHDGNHRVQVARELGFRYIWAACDRKVDCAILKTEGTTCAGREGMSP